MRQGKTSPVLDWHSYCWSNQLFSFLPYWSFQYEGGDTMKKVLIQLYIIAMAVMAYVLPVLADGGGD